MMDLERQQYDELSFYTLSHLDKSFIHQHIVDARIAQTADENTKPITIVFSLTGLYLFIEKGYTGRQVQQLHMKMAKNKRAWPKIILPIQRGDVHVSDVLAKPPGQERDEMIKVWCRSVWNAYHNHRAIIIDLVQSALNE